MSLVPLLEGPPARAYEEITRLEVRGAPGSPARFAYEELRERAAELGADAVIALDERTVPDATPAPYDPPPRPLLGNPYPGPLRSLEPGAFPPAETLPRVRGPVTVVEGAAIRFAD